MLPGVPFKPNSFYHIYLSGEWPHTLFAASDDYKAFLQQYTKLLTPIVDTCAYCLLPNHFHFLVRVHSLSAQIAAWHAAGQLAETFTPLNPQQQIDRLMTTCFDKLLPLTTVALLDETSFAQLVRYIHQNPAHHQHVDNFRDWRWSSYRGLLSGHPTRLAVSLVMSAFHSAEWFEELHWETQDATPLGYLVVED